MTGMLTGKVAFVTGGASGIGAASAIAMAREGARVAVADLNDSERTIAAIVDAGGQAFALALDVSDRAAVDAAVDEVARRWGRLDIGFNNAGIAVEMPGADWVKIDDYDRVVEINQRGVMLCMAAELRHMVPRGSGSIINTASIAGIVGMSGAGYCGSKHAVVGLTRSAALHHARDGIRVNCVCPGVIETPMALAAAENPENRRAIEQMLPMGRMGRAEEVAEGVVFLASDRASFITGHPLAIDGGYVAR